MSRQDTRLYNSNKFKLGLFALNCSGGLTMTKAPERWDASWDNNVEAARLADEAGLEFLLPVGRWHGYRGETDTEGTSFETLTWASGLLASTRDVCVFGTLHVAFVNPVFAAKQIVTADHIGKGRFGLNIVSGWNSGEFDMFGILFKDHDKRYAYTEEWLDIVKRIWSQAEPFDFDGVNFKLKGVRGQAEAVVRKSSRAGERRQFKRTAARSRSVTRIACSPASYGRRRWPTRSPSSARRRVPRRALPASMPAGISSAAPPARKPTNTTITSSTRWVTGRRPNTLRRSGPRAAPRSLRPCNA